MINTENALKFKDEGNALFAQKKFLLAYKKYTAAIKEDEKSAVLYANRAACCLSMNRYLDATSDAKKATELDSTYSKAWGRLGLAYKELGDWSEARRTLKRAISTLPIENLTTSEEKQKKQYEVALKEVESKFQALRNNASGSFVPGRARPLGNLPWDRARAMLPELQQLGIEMRTSSAWVIMGAYNDLSAGFELMEGLKEIPESNALKRTGGPLKVLEYITNGIMRDQRVFHIDDPDWITTFNKQVILEAATEEAWIDSGPSLILQEAQDRLLSRGWNHVRRALNTTMRAWIMRGFMANGLTKDHGDSVRWYEDVLDLLERGRRLWADVPIDERGTIFEDTFERGVRVLHLDAFMQACATSPSPDSDYTLARLLEHVEDLLEHSERPPPPNTEEYDPGFISSFYIYPVADALAIKGYYHREMARYHSANLKETNLHLLKSATSYLAAADKLPDDDEQSYWYIWTALDPLWACGTPLKVTLPLVARIREGIPKMNRIWEHSGLALSGRDETFQTLFWFEDDARAGIREGNLTENIPMTLRYQTP